MQCVTIDGTVIECDKFQTKQSGVMLKAKRGESNQAKTVGFVPKEKLMYIIPDDITHKVDELDEVPA